MTKQLLKRKTWDEFRGTGLLWFINTILHMFGWAIAVKMEDDEITDVYPARAKFRGFTDEVTTEGYQKVSKWLFENAAELYEESMLP